MNVCIIVNVYNVGCSLLYWSSPEVFQYIYSQSGHATLASRVPGHPVENYRGSYPKTSVPSSPHSQVTLDKYPKSHTTSKFRREKNKGRLRTHWMYNMNVDRTSLGLTLTGAVDLPNEKGQWRSDILTHRCQRSSIRA